MSPIMEISDLRVSNGESSPGPGRSSAGILELEAVFALALAGTLYFFVRLGRQLRRNQNGEKRLMTGRPIRFQ